VQKNAVRASHPDRIRTEFPALPYHRKAADDRLGPTALDGISSVAFAKASCKSAILRSRIDNRTVSQRPCLLPAPKSKRTDWGRRPQRPGNQHALARISGFSPGNSPSRITGCRWLCRNHSTMSGNLTFRCKSVSGGAARLAIQKRTAAVKKLWRTGLPCGRMRKTKKIFPDRFSGHASHRPRCAERLAKRSARRLRSSSADRQYPFEMTPAVIRRRLHPPQDARRQTAHGRFVVAD